MIVATGWVKPQVVNSVTDSILFSEVVGQVDASQRQALLESDSHPKRLPCEESSSAHWGAQMVAAVDKMRKYAAGMNREAL